MTRVLPLSAVILLASRHSVAAADYDIIICIRCFGICVLYVSSVLLAHTFSICQLHVVVENFSARTTIQSSASRSFFLRRIWKRLEIAVGTQKNRLIGVCFFSLVRRESDAFHWLCDGSFEEKQHLNIGLTSDSCNSFVFATRVKWMRIFVSDVQANSGFDECLPLHFLILLWVSPKKKCVCKEWVLSNKFVVEFGGLNLWNCRRYFTQFIICILCLMLNS